MSYMKNHAQNQAEGEALKRLLDEMRHNERTAERENLERLAWEAQAALTAYLEALTVFEKHRNEDAGRRASADFAAGRYPF